MGLVKWPSRDLAGRTAAPRIYPVDWEMAAVGPGLIDLAALVAGSWSDSQRHDLARAYWHALAEGGPPAVSWDEFLSLLDCCRLHLAVQYVGWATQWSPPSDQQQDWLGEALTLARQLRL